MVRQCAWCGRNLDGDGRTDESDGAVSHGICPDCLARVETGTGIPVSELLASLDEPVLLIDEEHAIGMLNRAARELLDAPVDDVLGERSGTVFDCENAHLPGGCSRTIHCSGCTIRQAVAHTHLTGEPRLDVPATLRVVDDPELTDLQLVISTARVGDRVLLKIDRYER